MPLRLGLVGHGRWGRNIERTLSSFSNVSVDVVPKGKTAGSGIDGVLIATQSATHADIAMPYVDAGIPTFIEKPIATSIADLERLRSAAKRSGALIFVGHVFLYNPAFLAAMEIVSKLGTILYLTSEGLNGTPRSDSSVLWDWLPHDLSMAGAILSRDPHRVSACRLAGNPRSHAALSKFQFGNVPLVSVVSWVSAIRSKKSSIVCEDATLFFDDRADRKLVIYGKKGDISYPAYSDEPPLTREIGAFLQVVRSGKTDAPHLEIGAAVVRAIVAAEESVRLAGESVVI